jgi:KaiC/GvpD/RAD55 family RecA-like ATPase
MEAMFPHNYAVLVVGDPGTGMFEFSCYLAASYLKNDERVVFAESDSPPERVRKQLRRFGVNAIEYEIDEQFLIIDCSLSTFDPGYDPGTRRVVDRSDLNSIEECVTDGVRKVGGPPVRVIFDSLTPFFERNKSEAICGFFERLCTDVRRDGNLTCTIHRGMIHEDNVQHVGSIADGIVEIMMDREFRRFVRISRMKGMEIKPKWVQFDFEKSEEEEGIMLGWGKE